MSSKNTLDFTDIVKTLRDIATWYGPIVPTILDMAQNGLLTWHSAVGLIVSTTLALVGRYTKGDTQTVAQVNEVISDFSHLESENDSEDTTGV